MVKIKVWAFVGSIVELFYDDGSVVKVSREDFNRSQSAIINASKEVVIRDFAI